MIKKHSKNKLNFELTKKGKNAVLVKNNNGSSDNFISQSFINLKDFYNKPLTLGEWVDNLKTLKISDGTWDEDFLLVNISNNNEQINDAFKIKRNFKKQNKDDYNLQAGKYLKKYKKGLEKELDDYLELVDDVIYNIEVDWNDAHNFEHKLNLYNTTLEKVENTDPSPKTILIEKPQNSDINAVKNMKDMVWNSQVIKDAKESNGDAFDAKTYTKYLKSISYNSVAKVLDQIIDEGYSVKGITNALKNLWDAISTKKVSSLKKPLYELLSALQKDSDNAQKIVKSLHKDWSAFKKVSDIELLNNIISHINVDAMLRDLEDEINDYRILFDIILRRYAIAQHIAKDLFIKEVKAATNFDDRFNGTRKRNLLANDAIFDKDDTTKVKDTDKLADYQYVEKFRESLYDSIVNASKIKVVAQKENAIDEKLLNNYFQKINVEAGILYDLNELLALLEVQYEKDKKKLVGNKKDPKLDSAILYSYQQGLLIKKLSAFNMIYKNAIFHLKNLLDLQNDLEIILMNTHQNWLVYFDKWIEFKKVHINKNSQEFKGLKNTTLEITLPSDDSDEKPVKAKPVSAKNLKVLENKFSKAGVKIEEIVNITKNELENEQS